MSQNKGHHGKSGHKGHDHDSGHHKKFHFLIGTKGDDVLAGTEGKDIIVGGKGNDQIDGGTGNDFLFGGKGNDLLWGGAGNDFLFGDKGNDLLDGGAGSDVILADKGDDTANYTLSANVDAKDFYDGGKGFDTLRLTLTTAEAEVAKEDIAAFKTFLENGGKVFHFESFGLTVRNFEKLEIVEIGGGNTAPVAVGNNYAATEDVVLVIAVPGVLADDSDAESSPLTAALVTGPTHGNVTLSPDGSFTYTPDADFNGADSFTYVANDGALDSDPATVSLTVNAVNDKPLADPDSYSTNEDIPLTVAAALGVLAGDTDAESSPLTAALVTGPTHGNVTLSPDGSFTYTPDADFNGADSFTYVANDGALDSDPATVSLAVNAVNDAPDAVDDTITETAVDGRIQVAVVGGSLSTYVDAAAQLADSEMVNIAAHAIPITAFATASEWATELAKYEVVVLGENGGTTLDYDGSQLFAALLDFVNVGGGGVVTTGWFASKLKFYSSDVIDDADAITPVAANSPVSSLAAPSNSTITILEAAHPIAGGVESYTTGTQFPQFHELAFDVDPSAAVLATGTSSTDGATLPAIAYDEVGQGLTVYLGALHFASNAFSPGFTRVGEADQIFEQAVAWAAGARGSAAVTVTIAPADLLGNDFDIDGDALAIDNGSFPTTSAKGAAISFDANGDIVYAIGTQELLQNLLADPIDSFDYTVSDGHVGGTEIATVNLTINGLDNIFI